MAIVNVGPLSINTETRTVTVNGARIHLTGKEFAIIELLAIRAGQTVTKAEFFRYLYSDDEPDAKILDVFICKARRKIRLACGGIDPIATIWGRGYSLPLAA